MFAQVSPKKRRWSWFRLETMRAKLQVIVAASAIIWGFLWWITDLTTLKGCLTFVTMAALLSSVVLLAERILLRLRLVREQIVHLVKSNKEKSDVRLVVDREEDDDEFVHLYRVFNQKADDFASLYYQMQQQSHHFKNILDHVTFGFVFLDRAGFVQTGYSRSCLDLCGFSRENQDIAGLHAAEILGADEQQRNEMILAIEQMYEGSLPDEIAASQFPHRFLKKSGVVLAVDARPMRDPAGEITQILLTITDETDLFTFENEQKQNRVLLQILRCRDAFAAASRHIQQMLQQRLVHTTLDDLYVLREFLRMYELHAFADDCKRVIYIKRDREVKSCDEEVWKNFGKSIHTFWQDQFYDEIFWQHGSTWEKIFDGHQSISAEKLLGPLQVFTLKLAEKFDIDVVTQISCPDIQIQIKNVEDAADIFLKLPYILRRSVDYLRTLPEVNRQVSTLTVDITQSAHGMCVYVRHSGVVLAQALAHYKFDDSITNHQSSSQNAALYDAA